MGFQREWTEKWKHEVRICPRSSSVWLMQRRNVNFEKEDEKGTMKSLAHKQLLKVLEVGSERWES